MVNTMSEASDDALAPRAPIATPTVAAASAGASLIPSPTITVTARPRSARTAATLSAGLCWARTSSSPSTVATSRAGSARSPVSITNRVKPAARSRRIVRGACRRKGSRSSTAPRGSPSMHTHASAALSSRARLTAPRAHVPITSSSGSLPTVTRRWSRSALTPRPGSSLMLVGSDRCKPRASASVTIASARTCGDI